MAGQLERHSPGVCVDVMWCGVVSCSISSSSFYIVCLLHKRSTAVDVLQFEPVFIPSLLPFTCVFCLSLCVCVCGCAPPPPQCSSVLSAPTDAMASMAAASSAFHMQSAGQAAATQVRKIVLRCVVSAVISAMLHVGRQRPEHSLQGHTSSP